MDFPTLGRMFLKYVSKRSVSPEYVLLQATSKCNVKCVHCFLWEETGYGWENTNYGKYDLSLDELRKISRTMPRFYFMNITGGEPFTRRDLPELVQTFYENNRLRAVLIPSNGTLLEATVQAVAGILDRCPKLSLAVDISLDGLDGRHDTIRGAEGTFEKALKTYAALKTLQRDLRGLQIGVIIAYMKSNQDSALELYEFIKQELKPDSIPVALVRGTPLDRKEREVDITNYSRLVRRLEQDLVSGTLRGFRHTLIPSLTVAAKILMHRQIERTVKEGFQIPCLAAAMNVMIYSNGDVYPCEILGADKKIGNLREANYNFQRLWDSLRRREISDWILKTNCHCTHECHIPVNLLFNPRRLPSLLETGLRLT